MPWKVYWDNGADACGVFPNEYGSEEEATDAAAWYQAEALSEGVWEEDGFAEAVWVDEEPVEHLTRLPDHPQEED